MSISHNYCIISKGENIKGVHLIALHITTLANTEGKTGKFLKKKTVQMSVFKFKVLSTFKIMFKQLHNILTWFGQCSKDVSR